MPRKGPAPRRELMPDPVYHSVLVTQVVNKILLRGKRSVAERIVYDAMKVVEEKTGSEPLSTLKRAIENVKPQLEVKSRRATTLAIRWLVGYSRQRREKTMALRLANEILDAGNGLGASVKRREDMHKMAESNKAFAHYRW